MSGARHRTTAEDVEVRLIAATIECLYVFSPPRSLRPYLLAGFGGFRVESADDEFTYRTDGPGTVLGVGMNYFLGKHFALDFSARGEWINFQSESAELTLPGGNTVTTEKPIEDSGFAGKFALGVVGWF